MKSSEATGHAFSIVILVAGGLFFKSIVLNWVVGPLVVVATAVASVRTEAMLTRRRGRT